MVSLLDIAPPTETVSVSGNEVQVYGLSAEGLVYLAKFAEVRQLLGGGVRGAGPTVDEILALGGKVVAAVIACGCGMVNNKEAEAVASRFNLDTQTDFLTTIVKLTLPNGLAPFVEKLMALGATVGVEVVEEEASPKVMRMKSRKSLRS